MEELNIPEGTAILIGAPAQPMDQQVSIALGKLTEEIEGILEAHLPQILAVNVMDEPAQVLDVVLMSDADIGRVTHELGIGLSEVLPEGRHIEVWPVQVGHPMIADVRNTGCQI